MNVNWIKLVFSVLLITAGMYLMATGFVDYDAVPVEGGAVKDPNPSAMTPGAMGLLLLSGGVLALIMSFRR
jgi:hypothetical protein